MFELVKILCVVITALIIFNSIRFECSKALAFALFAIWLRFALSAFHEVTHDPLIGGLSINAMGSILIVMTGITYLPTQGFVLKKFIPLYIFLLVVLVSGLYNMQFIGLVNVIIKWTYLLVISLSIMLAIRTHNLSRTLVVLLKAFYLPITLLVLSIILGEVKATEKDGSLSYIGAYKHESSFSMIVVSFAFMLSIIDKAYLKYRNGLFIVAVILLYFVNYRTAMLTILPLVLAFILVGVQQQTATRHRILVLGAVTLFVVFSFYLIFGNAAQRFADISVFASNWTEFLKAPMYFSQAEKAIFSSRVYIWSQYLSEVANASTIKQILGHGPESWKGVFHIYAHNTYVSYAYEYGLAGLFTFIIFIFSIFVNAIQMTHFATKIKLIAGLMGFLIMNLATMPLWNIEGLIILALIFGVSLGSPPPKRIGVTHSQAVC